MKKIKKIVLTIAILVIGSNLSKAQNGFDSFLESGVEDISTLLDSYLAPVFEGFGFGMNSGWYNTAKPHKTLGFDLSITVSAAKVPTAKEFFTFNNADYQNIRLSSGTTAELPTLFGPNLGADDLAELTFLDPDTGDEVIRLSALTGLGIDEKIPLNAVPTPMVQIGLGLFKGTELKLRLVPESITTSLFGDTDDAGSLSVFGLGVVHDIKQWLPASKIMPFDLSVFIGYTKLKTRAKLEPDDASSNQFLEFNASSLTFQGVISKKIAFVTPFFGLGYAKSDVDFNLLGNYNTESSATIPKDPVALNFSNSGVRANLGVRLKLLFLTLTGEYAIQEYNTLSVGFGFSFR